ncbi:MAG: glycosyltransferase [Candidatus Promineifilaceae bacterium]|nr:glycosyltransferase [Candidatus Promineifilaceae bacterium]
MKLLFLTSRLPWPPDRGDRLRTYHLLRTFSKEHEIVLVSFVADRKEAEHLHEIEAYCRDIHIIHLPFWQSALSVALNIWRGTPLQLEFYRSRKMRMLVDKMLSKEKFQAAYIHLFRMTPYLMKNTQVYRVVDLTDLISQEISTSMPYRSRISRAIYNVELPRIASYERQVAEWADEAWLISDRDKFELETHCASNKLQTIPNGVNSETFYPMQVQQHDLKVIFVGNLSVFHNIDALRYLVLEIMPLVREQEPECNFQIVGSGAGREVRSLVRKPGIEFSGFVADLNMALNKSTLFIAPLRFSAGIQNKVLEAMTTGLPVVSTSTVNAGLGAVAGRELLVADEARSLADEVVRLLRKPHLRREIGLAGRRFVERQFGWDIALRRMRDIEKLIVKND